MDLNAILLSVLGCSLSILGTVIAVLLRGIRSDQKAIGTSIDSLRSQAQADKAKLVDRIHGVELRAAQTYVTKSEHLIDFAATEKLLSDKINELGRLFRACPEEEAGP